jgi:phosphatidylglycerol:prolipoprotein diacylglycerol transferase
MIRRVFPVIASFGPLTIRTYTLLIDAGVAAGLFTLYRQAPAGRARRWFDAGLAATAGGLLGARLLYAAANWAYYASHLGEVFQIWLGGLAWPGAVLGALAGAWLYCSRKPEPFGPILDALALSIGLLSLLGWGGCWAAGCAHGYEITPGDLPAWLAAPAPDIFGVVAARWPTQLAGMAWSLMALAAIRGTRHSRWPAGARGTYALSLVALGPLFLGFTRGDPMPLVGGFRLDVVGSALMLIGSSLAWAILASRRSPRPRSLSPAP